MDDKFSMNDKAFKLAELYLSNTFDFKSKSAGELATAYLDVCNEIDSVFKSKLTCSQKRSSESFLKY